MEFWNSLIGESLFLFFQRIDLKLLKKYINGRVFILRSAWELIYKLGWKKYFLWNQKQEYIFKLEKIYENKAGVCRCWDATYETKAKNNIGDSTSLRREILHYFYDLWSNTEVKRLAFPIVLHFKELYL